MLPPTRRGVLFMGAAAVASSAAPPGPWRELIRNNSFDGWRSPSGKTPIPGAWKIRDGQLTVLPYVHRRTDLWSVDEYGDFELEWEWNADKGANSGVKYWVQGATTLVIVRENERWRAVADPDSAAADEPTLEYSRGVEYQMADDEFEPSSLKRRDSRAGGVYGVIAPEPEAVRKHGEWNQSRILTANGRIEHWLNGTRVVVMDAGRLVELLKSTRSPIVKRRGPIALQYHQTIVSFRNMRVRHLD